MYQLLYGGYLMILIVPKGANEDLITVVRVSINLVFHGGVPLLTGIAHYIINNCAKSN